MGIYNKRQKGASLIEATAAIAVLGTVILGATNLTNQSMDDAKALVAAQHLQYVANAAKAYVTDNAAAIQAVATATVPAMISVGTLRGAGYLDAGFSSTNGYGQSACVVVLKTSPTNLEALVVSTGGEVMNDGDLQSAATAIGASGGAVYAASPAATATELVGSGGSYKFDRGNFHNAARSCDSAPGAGGVSIVPGHPAVALWFNQNAYSSGMLYRSAVAGRPELNRMSTILDMGGNAITNVASLHLSVATVAESACAAGELGTISRDATGGVLACDGANWKVQGGGGSLIWMDPVADYATLLATTCDAGSNNQVRNVTATANDNTPVPYVCYFDTEDYYWAPMAVSADGNLIVPADLRVSQNVEIGGNVELQGTLNTANAGSRIRNTFFGLAAGGAAYGEGDYNTAFGTSTLAMTNYASIGNTAVGAGALGFNSSGGRNTATGAGALEFNSTGTGNVANGSLSLNANTISSFNTAIGHESGKDSTGSGNVFIGHQADATATVNHSTAIGFGTKVSTSNTIAIGRGSEFTVIGGGAPNLAYQLTVNGDAGGSSWTNTSDKRFKKNIVTIENPVDKLLKLRGVNFEWRLVKGRNFEKGVQIGLIAQEVEAVIPEAVRTGSDGFKGVQYANLVGLLIEGFKSLDAKIKEIGRVMVKLTAKGNLLIGSLVDDGINKLQVNGSAVINGILRTNSIQLTPNLTYGSACKIGGLGMLTTGELSACDPKSLTWKRVVLN